MKRTLLGTIATIAILAAANAALGADMRMPGPMPAAPFFSWTGLYMGVHGGYGWSTSQGLDLKGGFGGGQIGYNYQMNNFVFGIEGDVAGADISQSVSGIAFGVPVSAKFSNDTLASLRGRFGVTFGNVLVYGTAGGGWGHGKLSGTERGLTVSDEQWHAGWSAGAGLEWAFMPNWSAKFEYLHYGLGSATYFSGGNFGNLDVDTVKVGVNYRFQ